jgi:hypothetical protein
LFVLSIHLYTYNVRLQQEFLQKDHQDLLTVSYRQPHKCISITATSIHNLFYPFTSSITVHTLHHLVAGGNLLYLVIFSGSGFGVVFIIFSISIFFTFACLDTGFVFSLLFLLQLADSIIVLLFKSRADLLLALFNVTLELPPMLEVNLLALEPVSNTFNIGFEIDPVLMERVSQALETSLDFFLEVVKLLVPTDPERWSSKLMTIARVVTSRRAAGAGTGAGAVAWGRGRGGIGR